VPGELQLGQRWIPIEPLEADLKQKLVKVVRTDDGTEFKGNFEDILFAQGRIHQITPEYEHHLPSTAEKTNQTIFNYAHASVRQSKLPNHFYFDAMHHAAYVHNPITHDKNTSTPIEIISNQSPDYSDIHKFGCVCIAFIVKEHRQDDLSQRGVRCRFLGYCNDFDYIQRIQYRCLREDNGEVFLATHVKFLDS
jgi:hypothetical protein